MIYAGIAVLIIVGLAFFMFRKKPVEEAKPSPTPAPTTSAKMEPKSLPKPEMIIDVNKAYVAVLKTSEGDITIELNAAATPVTVNNFVYLAQNKFYDNTIFHRVVDGFMIQGGDPTGTGMGSPGYYIEDEPFQGEYRRGTVAMARTNAPNSAGSQFFIVHDDKVENLLEDVYVIFGKVTSGIEVVDKIATARTTNSSSGELSKPVNPVTINTVDIRQQ